MSEKRDVRVVFVGDSFVAGIGDPEGRGWVGRVVAAAQAAGTELIAYNLGVGGDTSADVVRRWRSEVLPRLAAADDGRIVFSFGANDATLERGRPRVDAGATAANLEHLLERAHGLGLGTFLVGPAPVGDEHQHERILELSSRLATVAAAGDVPHVEVAGAMAQSAVWRAEVEAGDGAHPAARGYELLATLIGEPLLRWLEMPLR